VQHTVVYCSTLQHTATHCNTLQYTAIHCNTLQHTCCTVNFRIKEEIVASYNSDIFGHTSFTVLCEVCIRVTVYVWICTHARAPVIVQIGAKMITSLNSWRIGQNLNRLHSHWIYLRTRYHQSLTERAGCLIKCKKYIFMIWTYCVWCFVFLKPEDVGKCAPYHSKCKSPQDRPALLLLLKWAQLLISKCDVPPSV